MSSAKTRTATASFVRWTFGRMQLPPRRQRFMQKAHRRTKSHYFWSCFTGVRMCTPDAGTISKRKNPGTLPPAGMSGSVESATRKNTAVPTVPTGNSSLCLPRSSVHTWSGGMNPAEMWSASIHCCRTTGVLGSITF